MHDVFGYFRTFALLMLLLNFYPYLLCFYSSLSSLYLLCWGSVFYLGFVAVYTTFLFCLQSRLAGSYVNSVSYEYSESHQRTLDKGTSSVQMFIVGWLLKPSALLYFIF